MRHISTVFIIILAALLSCDRLLARPTTAYEAEQVVNGWLKADSRPLGTILGRTVSKIETFVNDSSQTIYYIVYIEPSGFVIISADNSVEPIIGFTNQGKFEPSPDNPLWALVHKDLNGRIAATQRSIGPSGTVENTNASSARRKWEHFINLAANDEGGLKLMGLNCLNDIRVIPFLQSQWGQTTVCGENCFNYYSPNNYPCGCLATTLAQLMRYFEHPTDGIGQKEFMVAVDNKVETYSTLGGDENGGPYNWSDMVLKPHLNCDTLTIEQRKAIGALCLDAGIAMHMQYSPEGSGALMSDTMIALLETFHYNNVVMGYNLGDDIGSGLYEMLNPCLDAKSPVLLGIQNDLGYDTGHAVLCDGYGYNSSTLYYHVNLGWNGIYDAWYNLPVIDVDMEYKTIISCLYNISTSGEGEIISGRVLYPEGNPIANATVFAKSGTQNPHTALTDNRGIYAFQGLKSDTTYRVWAEKEGYIFSRRAVATGTSQTGRKTAGNCWGIDFYPDIILDPQPISPLYVDNDAPGDPGPDDTTISDPFEDGSSEHPFDNIQEAIDIAEPGGTIFVLHGTYTGAGNRALDFKGKRIIVTSTDPNDPDVVAETKIDCNASEADQNCGFMFQSYETPQSILAGLTITGGYNSVGGGIICESCAAPTVMNCIFRDNQATYGGAIYIGNAGPRIINCQFNNNQADAGGAIYNFAEATDCNSILDNCLFLGNNATQNGGAVYNNGQVNSVFTNCVFTENTSSGGGGVVRNNYSTNLIFNNCIFNKNQAQNYGGVIRNSGDINVTINNCTFSANSAGFGGSSLACTVDDKGEGGTSSLRVINSIFYDGGNEIFNGDNSKITITYSNIQNSNGTGPWLGEGNFYADPCFADADNGDFHLKSQAGRYYSKSKSWVIDDLTSPCIDAGDTNSPIRDEPLPNGDIINMGAYGGTVEASKSSSI
jgi:predicted outer membrane repeat protein